MIISCSECKTRYVVAPGAIGKKGRLVKCSNCHHTWFEEAPAEDLELVPEIVIEEEKPDVTKPPQSSDKPEEEEEDVRLGDEPLRKNVPALVEARKTSVVVGWVVLAVFFIGSGLSLYFFKDFIEDNNKVAENLYEKWDLAWGDQVQPETQVLPPEILTIPHPASFLTMRQSVEVQEGASGPTLVIFLDIQNSGTEAVELPEMAGVIKNDQGVEVFTWTQNLVPSTVPAGGFQQYEIFVESIQTSSRNAEVSFTWPEEN